MSSRVSDMKGWQTFSCFVNKVVSLSINLHCTFPNLFRFTVKKSTKRVNNTQKANATNITTDFNILRIGNFSCHLRDHSTSMLVESRRSSIHVIHTLRTPQSLGHRTCSGPENKPVNKDGANDFFRKRSIFLRKNVPIWKNNIKLNSTKLKGS